MAFKTITYLLLGLLLLVAACNSAEKEKRLMQKAELAKKQENIDKVLTNINTYCPIDKKIDNGTDIHVASIYFSNYEAILTENDKELLNQIVTLQKKCTRNIIIIGNTSIEEGKSNLDKLDLSLKRATVIEKYLTKNISNNYIKVVFCADLLSKTIEDNPTARKYNQRAEIILTNLKDSSYNKVCLANNPNLNTNNKTNKK